MRSFKVIVSSLTFLFNVRINKIVAILRSWEVLYFPFNVRLILIKKLAKRFANKVGQIVGQNAGKKVGQRCWPKMLAKKVGKEVGQKC